MPTPREVRALVERFSENRASYVSGPYNETQTRIEFADRTVAKTAHERTMLQRQIAATDNQVDQLVYALYGLTEEEITIVEGRVESSQEVP